MRKTKLLAIVCAAVMLTACGTNNSGTEKSVSSEKDTRTSSVSSVKTPETSVQPTASGQSEVNSEPDELYAPLLPKNEEIFPDSEIKVYDSDGGIEYAFTVSNYKNEEYDAYVAKCRELGFTAVQIEQKPDNGSWVFNAHTADEKYFVVVNVVTSKNYLRIRAGAVQD